MGPQRLILTIFVGCLILLVSNPNLKSFGQSDGEFCGPNNECDEGFRCVQETGASPTSCFLWIFCDDDEPLNRLICREGEITPSLPVEESPPSEPNVELEQNFWCISFIDNNGVEQPCDFYIFIIIFIYLMAMLGMLLFILVLAL